MANSKLQALFPMNDVIGMFLQQARLQLEINTSTQAIFPSEIYKGFTAVNEYRRITGGWWAKGEGYKSFRTNLAIHGEKGDLDAIFTYNDYLRYVDIGVGKGTKAEQVQRGAPAKFNRRYTTHWNRKVGKSHRPAIMMEIRHFARRTMDYLTDYYDYKGQAYILACFDGENTNMFNFEEPMPKKGIDFK